MVNRLALLSALVLCSCTQEGIEDETPLPVLDENYFRCEVQPILTASCAFMACHGNDERPLEIYAAKRYRLGISWVDYTLPITDEELAANFKLVRGFVQPLNLLADKPLDTRAGGLFHRGKDLFGNVDVYSSEDNIGYQKLKAFAAGETADADCTPTLEVGL